MKQVIILALVFIANVSSQDWPETTIAQGTLRGTYWTTFNGRKFSGFSGIPYAEPPVGDLRFKPAIPAKPWKGVLNITTRFTNILCPQINVFLNNFNPKGSEDCLYLNVFTPQLPTSSNNKLLPVMVFIHGGGFTCGAANPHLFGPKILLDKDIVLVTINYRLGALGFLSTEDEVLPGNNGLKDQTLALKWVKDNIAHFGGDPGRITIFGQSAGGASTHFHVLSPLSRGLFHRAIAHSGAAIAGWALAPKGEAARNAKRLAEFLNCPSSSNKEMVECIRTKDAVDIVMQDLKFMEWSTDPLVPFKPVVEPNIEGAFISEHPIDIIQSGKAAKVPFMSGITTQDGAFKSAAIYGKSKLVQQFSDDFDELIAIILQFEAAPNKKDIAKYIKQFYFGNQTIGDSTRSEVTDLFTDSCFLFPQTVALELHARFAKEPIYSYLFGYRGTVSFSILFGDVKHDYGVCHTDDLIYLLSNHFFGDYKSSDSDKKMIEVMTTLWTNFAKTGNPTPETNSLIPEKWEPVHSKNLQYYFIKSAADMKMNSNEYLDKAKFWNKLQYNVEL